MKNINIKKYTDFLRESINSINLRTQLNSFNKIVDISIPSDLKDLSKELTNKLINVELPYKLSIDFGGINIQVNIVQSNEYYSNVNWMDFLNGKYEIEVKVPNNYDINYLVSVIIHEIRHMVDFTDGNTNNGLSSFDMELNLRKYNKGAFNEFFILIYISLEHELVARNNQIYPYIKFKNLTKDESLSILKSSFIWTALELLKSFDPIKFIDKFNEDELINITNQFIKEILYNDKNYIENKDELIEFYTMFNNYFNEISNRWKKILLSETDKIYERKIYYSFNENMINGYKSILKNMILFQ